jgi:hypothetical protein
MIIDHIFTSSSREEVDHTIISYNIYDRIKMSFSFESDEQK